jgi:hypothetical protein
VLIGGIPRSIRLRGLGHPLFGVAQYLLGRAAAVGTVALHGLLLGQRHSTSSHPTFWYLGHTGGYPGRPIDNRGGCHQ